MRLPVPGRSGLRGPFRLAIAALALAAALPAGAARAQYYDDPGYDGEYRPVPRRAQRAPVGYNCDAVQQGHHRTEAVLVSSARPAAPRRALLL